MWLRRRQPASTNRRVSDSNLNSMPRINPTLTQSVGAHTLITASGPQLSPESAGHDSDTARTSA